MLCPRDIYQCNKAGRVKTILVFQQDLQSAWKGMSVPDGWANRPPSPARHRASMWIQTPSGNGLISPDLLDWGSAVLHCEMLFSNWRDRASKLQAAAVGGASSPAADDWQNFSLKQGTKANAKPHPRKEDIKPATKTSCSCEELSDNCRGIHGVT